MKRFLSLMFFLSKKSYGYSNNHDRNQAPIISIFMTLLLEQFWHYIYIGQHQPQPQLKPQPTNNCHPPIKPH
jgi:hypothetical protein